MSRQMAEMLAKNPQFDVAIFGGSSRKHFPLKKFLEKGTLEVLGS